MKDLQKLAGHLNFVNCAIVPGHAFTRQMYAKFSGTALLNKHNGFLKPHHHIKLDNEFRLDCAIWERFLQDLDSVNRPIFGFGFSLVCR